MKAIILAAGRGVRMRPLTNTIPKCLLRIQGSTILERQIRLLGRVASKIYVMTGHCANQIRQYERLGFETLYNPFYYMSGDLASLWLAKHYLIDDSFLVVYSNMIFSMEDMVRIARGSTICALTGYSSRESVDHGETTNNSKPVYDIKCNMKNIFGGLVKIPQSNAIRCFSIADRLLERDGVNVSLTSLLTKLNCETLEARDKWFSLVTYKDIERVKKHFTNE